MNAATIAALTSSIVAIIGAVGTAVAVIIHARNNDAHPQKGTSNAPDS